MLYRKRWETKGLNTSSSTLRNKTCFTGSHGWGWNQTSNRYREAKETACLQCEWQFAWKCVWYMWAELRYCLCKTGFSDCVFTWETNKREISTHALSQWEKCSESTAALKFLVLALLINPHFKSLTRYNPKCKHVEGTQVHAALSLSRSHSHTLHSQHLFLSVCLFQDLEACSVVLISRWFFIVLKQQAAFTARCVLHTQIFILLLMRKPSFSQNKVT